MFVSVLTKDAGLPDATLARLLSDEDGLQERADQISQQMTLMYEHAQVDHHGATAESSLADIKELASLLDGRPKAMELLMDLISAYGRTVNLVKEGWSSDRYEVVYNEMDSFCNELSEIAYANHMTTTAAGKDWDPAPLLQHHMQRLEGIEGWDLRGVQLTTSWYLRKWLRWRVAKLLSEKVAGHHLPPELVEMIQAELLPDGDDLIIQPGRWEWFCSTGCERSWPTLTLDCDKDDAGNCRHPC